MPTIQLPSRWQPRGHLNKDDEVRARVLFPPEKMHELLKLLKLEETEPNPDKRKQLEEHCSGEIIFAAMDIIVAENLTKRPTPAQRKTTLGKIKLAAENLSELLNQIDPDSSEDLRRAMIADKYPNTTKETRTPFVTPWGTQIVNLKSKDGKPPPRVHPMLGCHDLAEVIDTIKKLSSWAQSAKEDANYRKDGNRPADMRLWLAQNILKIWVAAGHTPTLISSNKSSKKYSPFLAFVTAVAEPLEFLFVKKLADASMEDAVRRAIDKWKP